MKNIIKEIIQDLWKNISSENQKKFQSALEFLIKMKPDIKPDSKFKKNLKQKLETIISLNREPKTSFLSFLVPITSAVFVFGFLFYSFDDTFFVQQPANIDIIREKTLIDEEIQTIEDIFLEEVEKAEIQQNTLKTKSTPVPLKIETKEAPTQKINIIVPAMKEESLPVENDHSDRVVETLKIEDTQIIDILWDGEDIPSISESSLQMKGLGWWFEADVFSDDMEWVPESSINQNISDFENFCTSFSGSIIEEEESISCKWDTIECSLGDYLNQNCNWEKKN